MWNARVGDRFALAILWVSTWFSVSHYMHSTANTWWISCHMVLMRFLLFRVWVGKGIFSLLFNNCPSCNGCRCKFRMGSVTLETFNHLTCNATTYHFTSGCQIDLFDLSVFVPWVLHFFAQLLDGSGFETSTHNVQSENTWLLLDSLNNVILDQRNELQSCNICMLYASLHSISIFTCRCADCIKSCVLGRLCASHIFMKSSGSFVCQDEVHKAVARELAPSLNVEGDILEIGRLFTKSCTITVQILDCKFRAPPRSAYWNSFQDRWTSWHTFSVNFLVEHELCFRLQEVARSLMLLASSRWLFQNLADSSFHAWSHLLLDFLVVLAVRPQQWTSFCFALADLAKVSDAFTNVVQKTMHDTSIRRKTDGSRRLIRQILEHMRKAHRIWQKLVPKTGSCTLVLWNNKFTLWKFII